MGVVRVRQKGRMSDGGATREAASGRESGAPTRWCWLQSAGSMRATARPARGLPRRRGHRRLVTEDRHEELPCPGTAVVRRHVELHRRRVQREAQEGTFGRRKHVVVRQHEERRGPALGEVPRSSNGVATDVVGPAVPGTRAYLEQEVRRVANGTAAAVVGTLIGRDQTPVRQEAKPVDVAQPLATSSSPLPSGLQRIMAAVHGRSAAMGVPASVRVPNGAKASVSIRAPGSSVSGLSVSTLTPARTTSRPGMSWA